MAHPAWIDDVRFPSGISRAWPFWSCYMWPFVYRHVGCLYKLHSHFRWSIFLRIAWLISNVCQTETWSISVFPLTVSLLFLLMESISVPFSRFNSTKIRLSDHIWLVKHRNLPWQNPSSLCNWAGWRFPVLPGQPVGPARCGWAEPFDPSFWSGGIWKVFGSTLQ